MAVQTKRVVSSPVLAMLIFVVTEGMFFSALISSFLVIKAGTPGWAALEDVKLPVAVTGVNTLFLLLSGALGLLSSLKFYNHGKVIEAKRTLFLCALFGASFVVVQGYEWIQLLAVGMTIKSSIFGALFYLLIGAHGLHAAAGVGALLWAHSKISTDSGLTKEGYFAVQLFWLMIVVVWPFLYGLVYF